MFSAGEGIPITQLRAACEGNATCEVDVRIWDAMADGVCDPESSDYEENVQLYPILCADGLVQMFPPNAQGMPRSFFRDAQESGRYEALIHRAQELESAPAEPAQPAPAAETEETAEVTTPEAASEEAEQPAAERPARPTGWMGNVGLFLNLWAPDIVAPGSDVTQVYPFGLTGNAQYSWSSGLLITLGADILIHYALSERDVEGRQMERAANLWDIGLMAGLGYAFGVGSRGTTIELSARAGVRLVISESNGVVAGDAGVQSFFQATPAVGGAVQVTHPIGSRLRIFGGLMADGSFIAHEQEGIEDGQMYQLGRPSFLMGLIAGLRIGGSSGATSSEEAAQSGEGEDE